MIPLDQFTGQEGSSYSVTFSSCYSVDVIGEGKLPFPFLLLATFHKHLFLSLSFQHCMVSLLEVCAKEQTQAVGWEPDCNLCPKSKASKAEERSCCAF